MLRLRNVSDYTPKLYRNVMLYRKMKLSAFKENQLLSEKSLSDKIHLILLYSLFIHQSDRYLSALNKIYHNKTRNKGLTSGFYERVRRETDYLRETYESEAFFFIPTKYNVQSDTLITMLESNAYIVKQGLLFNKFKADYTIIESDNNTENLLVKAIIFKSNKQRNKAKKKLETLNMPIKVLEISPGKEERLITYLANLKAYSVPVREVAQLKNIICGI
jgi:hypothetical protein